MQLFLSPPVLTITKYPSAEVVAPWAGFTQMFDLPLLVKLLPLGILQSEIDPQHQPLPSEAQFESMLDPVGQDA